MGTLLDMATARQYREDDREELRRICCETRFLGRPIDPVYQDRELFADLFTNPYLDYEPEWTLVAETGGRIAKKTVAFCP